MSIARTAIRIAAVRAITGATLAGDRVADSAIDPVDITVTDERIPIITVTTDDDMANIAGRDINGANRHIDLIFEAAVATKIDSGDIVIPQTDYGMEMSLDIIEQQIERALFSSETPWSQAFMRLVPRIYTRSSRRGAGARKGIRFAARQIVYNVDVIAPPRSGEPMQPGLPYDNLISLMEGEPDLEQYGRLFRTIIEGGPMPDWQVMIAEAGLLPSEARAIGIMPEDVNAERDAARAAIAEEGEIDGVSLTIRAAKAVLLADITFSASAERIAP